MDLHDILFGVDDAGQEMAITYTPSENFEDDKSAIRWRAWWDKDYYGKVNGLRLQCYPVVRETPCGAWIDPHGYRLWNDGVMAWSDPIPALLKWVSNDGGQAWAKPTKAIAIDSLLYRYRRWSSRILNDIEYFMAAGNALAELFPEKSSMRDEAFAGLRFVAANGKRK